MEKDRFDQDCLRLGLDPNRIRVHQARVKEALNEGGDITIEIEDTCRIKNGGILQLDSLPSDFPITGVVAFVPAAGASSRYYNPLSKVMVAVRDRNASHLHSALKELRDQGASHWCLPLTLRNLLQDMPSKLDEQIFTQLAHELSLPKALLPCVKEGKTFFDLKLAEHARLDVLSGQCFVIAPTKTELFNKVVTPDSTPPICFFEQGSELSTIRFDKEGEPVYETNEHDTKTLSMVPAGHGTLTRIIPECAKEFKDSKIAFIRNIDNVMGTHSDVTDVTRSFLSFFCFTQNAIDKIRTDLRSDNVTEAEKTAQKTYQQILTNPHISLDSVQERFLKDQDSRFKYLWRLQMEVFHFHPSLCSSDQFQNQDSLLINLYQRPLSVLGQVPNTEQNVGGLPVFAKTKFGKVKLCIEGPHISSSDKQKLVESKSATHFNPVFVACETQFDPEYFEKNAESFWILAKKTYNGRDVYYHETVLFELLGNSYLSNCIFVEVPRIIFNPHKSLQASVGTNISRWIDPSRS